MSNQEKYETVIRLNAEQAKKEIDVLQKKYDDLVKKQSQYTSDSVKYKSLQKEIEIGFSRMLMILFDIEHLTGKEAIELVKQRQ